MPGVTPEFTRFLAMRWGQGGMPFSNTPSRHMGGWVRLRSDVSHDRVSEAHLLALVDAWPPAVLSYLKAHAPGSSLTWTIEFVHPLPSLTTHDWCLYQAEIEHALDGYGHISARSDRRPDRFIMSRSRAPALVTAADLMELDADSEPV